ncbi:hypothetical protein Zm00014a_030240 [Zea mays]|uniref:Uncharacterized protein n=1 Tax=Zea mays TaxID=4577 RepID=A0A3L6FJ87_MAIZE|nr:hypothetical protein Zm00014a_030240 [Zea mays]
MGGEFSSMAELVIELSLSSILYLLNLLDIPRSIFGMVMVCTFNLILKNVASLFMNKDSLKVEADTRLGELINLFDLGKGIRTSVKNRTPHQKSQH